MTVTTGLGFKREHLDGAPTARKPGPVICGHAENPLVEGGARLRLPIIFRSGGTLLLGVDPKRARKAQEYPADLSSKARVDAPSVGETLHSGAMFQEKATAQCLPGRQKAFVVTARKP